MRRSANTVIGTVSKVVPQRGGAVTIYLDLENAKSPQYLTMQKPPKWLDSIIGTRLFIKDDAIFVGDKKWATRSWREIELVAKG